MKTPKQIGIYKTISNHSTYGRFIFKVSRTRALVALVLATAISGIPAMLGQNWTGTSNDWNDPNNWSTGAVPTASEQATLDNDTYSTYAAELGSGASSVNNGVVIHSGTIRLYGDANMQTNGGNVRLGGYVNATNIKYGYMFLEDTAVWNVASTTNLSIGWRGEGYITLSGSSQFLHTGGGQLLLGEAANSSASARGILILNDNARLETNTATFTVGYGGDGINPSGVFTLNDSAKAIISSGSMVIARQAAQSGIVTLSSTAANDRATLSIFGGIGGASTAGKSKLVFDGGALKALSTRAAFITGNVAITTEGDGAFIDSNGFNIGIANTVSITGTSGLTKLGAGNLTLNTTAANTSYTGATVVNEGALVLTAANQLANSNDVNLAATGTITAANLAQTFNNLSGAGAINLGGGTATLDSSGASAFSGNLTATSFTKNGTGRLTLSGNNTLAANSALAAGILNIGHANALGATTNSLIMTGGTIQTASTITMQNSIQVQSGALNVDSVNRTTLAGDITGSGGIIKTGTGLAILSGNLSGLSGPVNVNQGVLSTGNFTGNITVANGAGFGGEGIITGNVTFLGDGSLQAGFTHNDAAVTTPANLAITGNVTFAGNALLRYDMYVGAIDTLTAANFTANDVSIDLTGIQNGTYSILALTSGTFDDAFLASVNTLGKTTQNGGNALGDRASVSYALSADKKELLLTSAKTNQVLAWDAASGIWDSSAANWSGLDTKFVDGDKVIFNAAGTNGIAIGTTGVVVSEISITGNGSYTFTGGAIRLNKDTAADLGTSFGGTTPTGVLTINTTGTVTFANDSPNTFANGINVAQGTLIGSVDTLGDANIANNGRTVFDQNIDAIYTGTMTGTGDLIKTGAAVLLVGNNLSGFTGRTGLFGGTFIIDNDTVYNSSYIYNNNTSDATNLVAGDNVTISGSVRIYNGSVTIGNNARVGHIETYANAGEGPSNITIGNGSIVNGSLEAAHGTGVGNVTLGANTIVTGSVYTRSGGILIGENSNIGGNVNTGGAGHITLGAGSTINGAAYLYAGRLTLEANSQINGPVTIRNGPLNLSEGSVINNSVDVVLPGNIHFLVRTDTNAPLPLITGDATFNGQSGGAYGEGKIAGTLRASGTTQMLIGPARVELQSDGGISAFYDAARILEIGNIILGNAVTDLRGSGTLITASVDFAGELTLTNSPSVSGTAAFAAGFTITGSLVSSGTASVTKRGSGNVILAAPSSYSGPTIVEEGGLHAGTEGAFSHHSAFTINEGAFLDLRGHSQTLSSVNSSGRIYISGNDIPSAGAELRIAGPYTASGANNGIVFNIVANDNAKPLTDQLIFADAANIAGNTKVFVQFTDNRTHWTYVVDDMDPLIIAENGALDPANFVLDDGRGYPRVILSQRDYAMVFGENGISLVATTAAEQTTALAANAVGIMASRAAYGSVSQRLDYLSAASDLPGNQDTGIQAWAQTYHHTDKLDGNLMPDSDGTVWGIQAGVDKRRKKTGNAYTTYGAFIDHTEASATLPKKTETDLSSTGIGGYISAHTAGNWHTDLVARYTWDSYKIRVGDAFKFQDGEQSMTTDGHTWGIMLRTAKIYNIGKEWTFAPQAQLAYQQRKINDTTDTFGRTYAFGPENMRLSDPASLEGRLGGMLRKLITINDKISLAPYLSAQFLYEFKGGCAVRFVNNTMVDPNTNTIVREDFGGDSYLFTLGVPVRLGKRIDAYIDASLQVGGPITGHGINFGINYRW